MKTNTFEYKDYIGSIEWSEDDHVFYGKLLGLRSLISYEGENIDQLRNDFRSSVDDYLDLCKRNNIQPEIPFKGSFNVRISPELHRRSYEKASAQGITLNKFVQKRFNGCCR